MVSWNGIKTMYSKGSNHKKFINEVLTYDSVIVGHKLYKIQTLGHNLANFQIAKTEDESLNRK